MCHGGIERDEQRLHDHRADEAAGQGARRLTKAGEHARELLQPRANPFGVERAQWF
jgi:hypothetical protein